MSKSQANTDEPVLSRPARKKTLTRVQLFLEAYRTTASVAAAAQIAGISRRMHYRKLETDEGYQKAFSVAKEEVSDVIEGELFRRAVHGEKEPVYYKGKKVAAILRKSDPLLMFIARGAMPDKYREHTSIEHSGSIDLVERLQAARKRVIEMRDTRAGWADSATRGWAESGPEMSHGRPCAK
jgi:hypothetical protein